MSARCPFSGQAGGKCPFGGGGQIKQASPPAPTPQGARAEENRVLAESKPTGQCIPMAGRLLGNALQQRLDKLTSEDPDLCCPVSLMVFKNPVIASDGFTYEELSLQKLLSDNHVSPMTREKLKRTYRHAQQKKVEVIVFLKHRSQDLLDFATEAATEEKGLALTALERVTEYIEVLDMTAGADMQVAGAREKAARTYEQIGSPVPAALRLN